MNCKECGIEIVEGSEYCLDCSKKQKTKEIKDIKKEERKSFCSMASFFLAFVPLALFSFCYVLIRIDESYGAVGWFMVVYLMVAGLPVVIIGVILGLLGITSKKRLFSYLGIALHLCEFLLVFWWINWS